MTSRVGLIIPFLEPDGPKQEMGCKLPRPILIRM